ncbi:MAG: VCBS repeat-containing protein [Bacteroidales bacterium]|nr:VCBS repeat-containing protein [Bacteroidales bacterium]
MHFGLGTSEVIDSIKVHWPDKSWEVIKNVTANKLLTLDIKNAHPPAYLTENLKEGIKLFSRTEIPGIDYVHKEDNYVDFKREILIPHSLSADGPALAVGDVNGDGLEDLFAGGAKGEPAKMFIQQNNGSFRELEVPQFLLESSTEDVDAVFFDADGDLDQDLYVVRGGNENPLGDPLLEDLLLINDGKGGFRPCEKGSLPYTAYNGSSVSASDFDADGDIDLFVGSRSIPGAYGLPPEQLLLENDGKGRFKDVTASRMPGQKNIGMVTDSEWMDYDKDGDFDLILAGEWMKICILKNDNGVFSDATQEAGLEATSGWWNCIEATDIDLDGDLDLIGGNLGLNSIFRASVKEPVEMYLNDFDNNGLIDQIICSYEDGISYPVASLDELAAYIAGVGEKYTNYSDFGGKNIRDIFGNEAVNQSVIKKAVLQESCLFINNGDGTFQIRQLPVEAQFSPVRDIIVKDFNQDSIRDIVLAGNNYQVSPSIGRYDASYGWYLTGNKSMEFKALMPAQSGLIIKGDSRRLLTIRISGKEYLIAAVNNSDLEIFLINKPSDIKGIK